MMQRDLIAWEIQIASLRKLLKKYEIELATSKEIQQFEVFETLLRGMSVLSSMRIFLIQPSIER